jgi:hypothetical protein
VSIIIKSLQSARYAACQLLGITTPEEDKRQQQLDEQRMSYAEVRLARLERNLVRHIAPLPAAERVAFLMILFGRQAQDEYVRLCDGYPELNK